MTPHANLAALRAELAARGLDGFVVPLTDEHMSEYVGAYAQRLAWLTGFQGSAGSAVVLPADHGRPTLLLLHGRGGTENDLVALARAVAPGWGIIAPRGAEQQNGGHQSPAEQEILHRDIPRKPDA